MLAGGHQLPPGLGLDSLASGHLERCEGYKTHSLGSTGSQERFEMRLGCGWRREVP